MHLQLAYSSARTYEQTCVHVTPVLEDEVMFVASSAACSTLYAPLGFFLQNPVGELLVAFTKDQVGSVVGTVGATQHSQTCSLIVQQYLYACSLLPACLFC
jgi:hypothetical protein